MTEPRKPTIAEHIEQIREAWPCVHSQNDPAGPSACCAVKWLVAKLREAEQSAIDLGAEACAQVLRAEKAEARAGRLEEALELVAANTSDVHILKVADGALRKARREEPDGK